MGDGTIRGGPGVPPQYFLVALLSMVGLHFLLPVRQLLPSPWRYLGILAIAGGIALVLWAAGLFRRAGTPVRPFERAAVLVLDGPYRFTRNPMYLGLSVVLLGAAALLGSLTPFLVVPVFVGLLDRLFIRREEEALTARFGEDYRALGKRVRRWL
jgi:protein-S-isoprenylcysteine O-methyltransferase Ste14